MEQLLTVKQVAELLQVKRSAIYQLTHQYIPHVKLGNLVRFRVSEIGRWVEKQSIAERFSR